MAADSRLSLRIFGSMAVGPIDLSPELREAVARARQAAEALGELRRPASGH